MGRIRALARLDQAAQANEQGVEQLSFRLALDQSGAEFAEHGVIEAGVGQRQAQRKLPIDAAAHGIGGLTVGQALQELQGRDQREPRQGPSGENRAVNWLS